VWPSSEQHSAEQCWFQIEQLILRFCASYCAVRIRRVSKLCKFRNSHTTAPCCRLKIASAILRIQLKGIVDLKERDKDKKPVMANVMVLFGSGGHSAEMLMLIRNAKLSGKLGDDKINKLTCVLSDDDNLTEEKIDQEFAESKGLNKLEKVRLRRARKVGQSYITSIWTTLTGIISSIRIIRKQRPNLCLSNGPAISVIVSIAIRFIQVLFLGRYNCQIIFIESFCRTRTLSLAGRIIYNLRLADMFLVQWPQLANNYPRCLYKGIIV
jgi:beta-1,4-N-acetylglucosaminyltransferase